MRRRVHAWPHTQVACFAVALLVGAGPVWADDPNDQPTPPAGAGAAAAAVKPEEALTFQPANADKAWRFDLSTWIWMVGLVGDVGVRGRTAEADVTFVDIIDHASSIFGFDGRLEVGYGRWGAYVDGLYADIAADNQSGPRGFSNIDITVEMAFLDFGLMYRLADWTPYGEAAKNRRNCSLDLYGGGRYTNLDVKFEPARLRSVSRSVDWVDPVVGLKLVLPMSEHWSFTASGDVGGFGAASEFAWSANGVFGLDFTLFKCPATFYFGYRGLGQDYHKGSGNNEFTWDVTLHGPILGLSIKF